MGYVAVKGGEEAIARAEQFLQAERTGGVADLLRPEQIRDQLYLAVDRVMGEGSLYAPELAALAFKQAAGDTWRRPSSCAPIAPRCPGPAIPSRSAPMECA